MSGYPMRKLRNQTRRHAVIILPLMAVVVSLALAAQFLPAPGGSQGSAPSTPHMLWWFAGVLLSAMAGLGVRVAARRIAKRSGADDDAATGHARADAGRESASENRLGREIGFMDYLPHNAARLPAHAYKHVLQETRFFCLIIGTVAFGAALATHSLGHSWPLFIDLMMVLAGLSVVAALCHHAASAWRRRWTGSAE